MWKEWDLGKDWIRSEEEGRVRDTLWVSSLSKRMDLFPERAQSAVEGSLEVHFFIYVY